LASAYLLRLAFWRAVGTDFASAVRAFFDLATACPAIFWWSSGRIFPTGYNDFSI